MQILYSKDNQPWCKAHAFLQRGCPRYPASLHMLQTKISCDDLPPILTGKPIARQQPRQPCRAPFQTFKGKVGRLRIICTAVSRTNIQRHKRSPAVTFRVEKTLNSNHWVIYIANWAQLKLHNHMEVIFIFQQWLSTKYPPKRLSSRAPTSF